MRRSIVFFIIFSSLLALAWRSLPEKQKAPSYFSHFKSEKGFYRKNFEAKIKKRPPSWILDQIKSDLSPFANRKITLNSINKTEESIQTPQRIMRYRIVDNRLYASKKWKFESFEPIERFETALLTLCSLVSLPDIDFIVNHEDGTDIPFYLTENQKDQAPIFGWAKLKSTPYLVLVPDYRSVSTLWFDDIRKIVEGKNYNGKRLAWNERENRGFWRGVYSEPVHRLKIAELSKASPNLLDAGLTTALEALQPYFKPHASYEEHMRYKYLPVLDGIMCTYPGYQWRLLSDSLTMKQESDQMQWFYGALKPYEHFVPVANDMSDILEKIEWAKDHDLECQQIAANAKSFCLKNLMFDDVYVYLYHVLKLYASCLDYSVCLDLRKTLKDSNWVQVRKGH